MIVILLFIFLIITGILTISGIVYFAGKEWKIFSVFLCIVLMIISGSITLLFKLIEDISPIF